MSARSSPAARAPAGGSRLALLALFAAAMGWLEGGEVVCPLHGYKFDLKTGACSTDPKLKAKIFKFAPAGENFIVKE